ncbi:MAG TPA: hypothetical protein PL133_07745, partial [Methylophilaceae bacterium]|nr:hypothetical protein [Methylophilaceae bacterium]
RDRLAKSPVLKWGLHAKKQPTNKLKLPERFFPLCEPLFTRLAEGVKRVGSGKALNEGFLAQ